MPRTILALSSLYSMLGFWSLVMVAIQAMNANVVLLSVISVRLQPPLKLNPTVT